MSADVNDKKKFKEKLGDYYRIIVIDVEDLKEVGNYQLSMAKIYAYIIAITLIFSIFLISLIAFTPIKRLMPGYGDIEENSKFVELRKKIGFLEEELETQVVYTQGLQNMLAGKSMEQMSIPNSSTSSNETVPSKIISEADLQESKITQSLNRQYFVPPVSGIISAPFNAIKAIAAGMVIGSDFTLDTGNTISIQHSNNIVSIYKHNSALLKKSGDKVHAGEAIAIIGNTGELTDGPHLHFELWYNGNPVNAENFINFK